MTDTLTLPAVATFTNEPTGLWFSLSLMWAELGAHAETNGDYDTADFLYEMADTAEELTTAFASDGDRPLAYL